MAKVEVDGRVLELDDSKSLLEALLDEGVDVPHFCFHEALGKDGNCRMCMVEIEGKKRPQIACDTPIKEGMVVRTKGENIEKVRRSILELELINHPVDCPICDQAGECKLQDYYMEAGLYHSRLDIPKLKFNKKVDLGANVLHDEERCVLCLRCVRFCRDITKTRELGVKDRGDKSVVTTFEGQKLHNNYAMNIVDLCPVGAMTSKDFRFKKRSWFLQSFESICDGCARGCNIYIDHSKDKWTKDTIYRYRPRKNSDINGHFICDYGRLSYKKEQNSRVFDFLIKGKKSQKADVLEEFYAFLNKAKGSLLFILGANLSNEDIEATLSLADDFNALVSGYSDTVDSEFGDDFLRVSDKSSNKRALIEYGVDISYDYLKESLAISESVVIVENREFDENPKLVTGKRLAYLTPFKSPLNAIADIVLPTASFSEKIGTYINIDGIKQTTKGVVDKEEGIMEIGEIVNSIQNYRRQ